jgi:hypothetical protein
MPLSNVQKGAIGQFAFLSTALATGGGEVEAYVPVADNERRDAEIRRHLKSTPGVTVQVKVAFRSMPHGRARTKYLRIVFSVRVGRLIHDARFLYFFAVYDESELRLHDPCFLIPSDIFHKIGRDGRPQNGVQWFSLEANLGPHSRDKWSRFRVSPNELGMRLLEVIDEAPLTAARGSVKLPTDSVWLWRSSRPTASRRRSRAA